MKDDSSFWVADSNDQLCLPMKRGRQVRQKKVKFIGWGSKPLIEFLKSIGKDTSKELSRHEVTAIVNEYVTARNLADPAKKKKIICDQWLLSIFGKKKVPRIKIFDLLGVHFAENRGSSDDDVPYSSEEEENGEKNDLNFGRKPSSQKQKIHNVPENCFAAVCPENIKLVYLKKTLVQDLLKTRERFKDKVIGSFVRIKSDPTDYRQKNSHQLQQVVGVSMNSEADSDGTDVRLQLSNNVKEFPIEKLSDENFLEEECKDLLERVKAGSLSRPTFVEFEAKARMLHKDRMKHWIPGELSRLQKLIERANEKGWRKELFDYLEKRKLLEKQSEQDRLIADLPKVIADEIEYQATPIEMEENSSSPRYYNWEASDNYYSDVDGAKQGNRSSPKSYNWEASDNYYSDDAGSGDTGIPSATFRGNPIVPELENTDINFGVASKATIKDCQNSIVLQNGITAHMEDSVESQREMQAVALEVKINEDCQKNLNTTQTGVVAIVENDSESRREMQNADLQEDNVGSVSGREVRSAEVIELSDEDDDEIEVVKVEKRPRVDVNENVWQYLDPQGFVQGPFPLALLMRWYQSNYFDPGFKVWKNGESQQQAVLLVDALRRAFSP